MSKTFYLEVITSDKRFFTGDVESLNVRTPEGEIGIMGGHIPMVVAITPSPLKIKRDGDWLIAFISEGFMEVKQDKTIVIADFAEWPNEIDIERAEAAAERARLRLKGHLVPIERIRTKKALHRALMRIKVAKMLHH